MVQNTTEHYNPIQNTKENDRAPQNTTEHYYTAVPPAVRTLPAALSPEEAVPSTWRGHKTPPA